MADTAQMLCKALELAEESARFYAGAETGCEGSLGRDVFARLKEEAEEQLKTITAIHKGVTGGKDFSDACVLGEEDMTDSAEFFAEMVERHNWTKACTTELGALETASDIVHACLVFYQDWMKTATSDVERAFVERVLQEQRGQHLLIKDAQYYYEDPEAWSLDRGGLDGA